MSRPQVIFFGNGPLADSALEILRESCDIILEVHKISDLEKAKTAKQQHPEAFGVLASFGVIIRDDFLEIFEPIGILNIHPSLLPKYRGPSPIETAILSGDTKFGVSVMKLAHDMDAGEIYYQATTKPDNALRPDLKSYLYRELATLGAKWLTKHLENLPTPIEQDHTQASFTEKLDKSLSFLHPQVKTAEEALHEIIAYQGYPKPKYTFCNVECVILAAHLAEPDEQGLLTIECSDNDIIVDQLQPAGKKPMDAKSFLNGYGKEKPKNS